jgi:hypothetical protein
MGNRSLERLGAASGLAFVVLSLLSAFIYPQQPRSDAPASVTLAWVHDHRVALQAGMIVALFAAGVFLWFVGYLRVSLAKQEDGEGEMLATVVFGGGIAVAVVGALAALPTALLAFMDAQPAGISDAGVVRMLGDLNTVLFSASSVMTAAFLAALAIAMLRDELAASWLGWLTVLVVLCNGVAVWVGVTFSSYHGKGWNAVGWGAFIGFLAVVLLTSISRLTRPGTMATTAPSVAVP